MKKEILGGLSPDTHEIPWGALGDFYGERQELGLQLVVDGSPNGDLVNQNI